MYQKLQESLLFFNSTGLILGPLYHFPKPDRDMERFDVRKGVLDNATKEKGNIYIYNQLRLCNKHFENYYKLPSNRLIKKSSSNSIYYKW